MKYSYCALLLFLIPLLSVAQKVYQPLSKRIVPSSEQKTHIVICPPQEIGWCKR
jgi:hypothetical protein